MEHQVQDMELPVTNLVVLAEDSSTCSVETRKEMVTKVKVDVFVVVMVLHHMMLLVQAMELLLMMLPVIQHQATVLLHMKPQAILLHLMKHLAILLHLMKHQAILLHLMKLLVTLLHLMKLLATLLLLMKRLQPFMELHLIQLQFLAMEHLAVHAEDSFLIPHQMESKKGMDMDIKERKVAHVLDIQPQFPTVPHHLDMDLLVEEPSTSLVEIKKKKI